VKLHDVENVEAFCSTILDIALAANGGYLRPDQREEALDFLLLTAVELGDRFRPGHMTFRRYAGYVLRCRVNDWYRKTLGDNRAGPRPTSLSLDEIVADEQVALPPALVGRSHEEEVLNRVALYS
jgi:hypothetical protein